MPQFSIIIATLNRRPAQYTQLMQSIIGQTYRDYEVISRFDPEVNEYYSRNRAAKDAVGEWYSFLDDDTWIPPDYLETALWATRRNPNVKMLTGPLQGNMFGQGQMVFDGKGLGVGANMIVKAEAFHELSGFEESWGLSEPHRGWRADSDMLLRIQEKYGVDTVAHIQQMVVNHPNPMGSVWQPEVEAVFFQRHRKAFMERYIPLDPRAQEFLFNTQQLTDKEKAMIVQARAAIRKSNPGISAQLPWLPGETKQ